jgi:hypothetical protein
MGVNLMRAFLLALGVAVALGASAEAATVHHREARHLILHYGHGAPSRVVVVRPRYDDTPSYNDPSKFGGQSLGMDP